MNLFPKWRSTKRTIETISEMNVFTIYLIIVLVVCIPIEKKSAHSASFSRMTRLFYKRQLRRDSKLFLFLAKTDQFWCLIAIKNPFKDLHSSWKLQWKWDKTIATKPIYSIEARISIIQLFRIPHILYIIYSEAIYYTTHICNFNIKIFNKMSHEYYSLHITHMIPICAK